VVNAGQRRLSKAYAKRDDGKLNKRDQTVKMQRAFDGKKREYYKFENYIIF
jgi:hypothetical protein